MTLRIMQACINLAPQVPWCRQPGKYWSVVIAQYLANSIAYRQEKPDHEHVGIM